MFFEILSIISISVVLIFIFIFFRSNTKKNNENQFDEIFLKVKNLSETQHQLFGGIQNLTDVQNNSNNNLLKYFENRLTEIQEAMNDRLSGSASITAKSLGSLQERLITIDKAQNNIEKLSYNVLSLQDILSNKQSRGAFGEIQLNDIVKRALPPDSYKFQALLSNGKRVDCLINLPNPPGPISVDSKFPLEAYEKLIKAKNDLEKNTAKKEFRSNLREHIKSISSKYIIYGDTSDGALMFLPSEAIYSELHSNFSDIVRESFDAKVWIVSPTTCMATLNTMRAILKDSKLKEQTERISVELKFLMKDMIRLAERSSSLSKHFGLAQKDLEEIEISTKKTLKRADKLENLDFGDKVKADEDDVKTN